MILVQNCRMIDPASKTDGLRDILIGEDRITKIAEAGTIDPAQITKRKRGRASHPECGWPDCSAGAGGYPCAFP